MEGDETGSEEGVKDEGRRTELFKQKQRGEFPPSSSLVFLICTFSSSSSCSGASNSGAGRSGRSGRVQMLLSPLCVATVHFFLLAWFLGFFVIVKSKI